MTRLEIIDDGPDRPVALSYIGPSGKAVDIAKGPAKVRPFMENAVREFQKQQPARDRGTYITRRAFEEAIAWVLVFGGSSLRARQLQDVQAGRDVNMTRACQGDTVGDRVRATWRKVHGYEN